MTKKYKTIETWQNAMKKDKTKSLWRDWFNIGGHWYTCEEYDNSGKYMRFTSITAWQHIDIETSDRYSKSWLSDMEVTAYPIEDLRFDISHYLDDDVTQKQLKDLSYQLDEKQVKSLLNYILINYNLTLI